MQNLEKNRSQRSSRESSLGRREFTVKSAMALLSGVAITISGCGGIGNASSSAPTSPTSGGSTSRTGVGSANHGHSAALTNAELTGGNAIGLSITGSAGHQHIVILLQSDLAQIAAGQRVAKQSEIGTNEALGDHTHFVTFN